MNPEDELALCVGYIITEAQKLAGHLDKSHMHELANSLNRIERWARTGGYCIFDIADMA